MLAYLLHLLGCKTAAASGRTMRLRVAQLFQPALVILDLEMPGQDGCEVMAETKRLEGPASNALFVGLTGKDDDRVLDSTSRLISRPAARPSLDQGTRMKTCATVR